MKKIVAVIPARYQSSRFPGKPLADICGKPMIQWVYESVAKVPDMEAVYVATDDERIFDAVTAFGGKAIMTGACSCGTDRVYQAVKDVDCDVVLNIQGDEPLIKVEMIQDLMKAFTDDTVVMATLKKQIENPADIDDANVVKVITDCNDDAIYFSRHSIPYNRDAKEGVAYYRHIGAYGYTKAFLETYVNLPTSVLENVEKLEQLRVLENGYKIRVKETVYQSIGVDLPEHIALVEEEIKRGSAS
jgi:3-deoxy-manno-octulosonate cytidylyltransferase (CMP-KDO synthetase)